MKLAVATCDAGPPWFGPMTAEPSTRSSSSTATNVRFGGWPHPDRPGVRLGDVAVPRERLAGGDDHAHEAPDRRPVGRRCLADGHRPLSRAGRRRRAGSTRRPAAARPPSCSGRRPAPLAHPLAAAPHAVVRVVVRRRRVEDVLELRRRLAVAPQPQVGDAQRLADRRLVRLPPLRLLERHGRLGVVAVLHVRAALLVEVVHGLLIHRLSQLSA